MKRGRNHNMRNTAIIVTNPMIAQNESAKVTLSKFIRVISPIHGDLSIIGGNLRVEEDISNIKLISWAIRRASNKVRRILDIVALQFKMAIYLITHIKKNQIVYFWIADKMILPYCAAKIKRAEINYFIYGNVAKEGKQTRFTKISSSLIKYMAKHASYTCMESESVIDEWPSLKVRQKKIIHLYTDNIHINPFEERKKIFGMVCRLTEGKHVIESIGAMIRIHNKYPDWKLEIIGSGKQENLCKQMVNENNAEEYIKLWGWIDHDDIIGKSKLWKVFLFPTDTEGMPNSLIEMMGRGIPAITSSVGGISDIVENNYNSMFLENTDVESIYEKMIEMIELTDAEYEKISTRAIDLIDKEYSLKGAMKHVNEELKK